MIKAKTTRTAAASAALLILGALIGAPTAHAQGEDVGSITFPTSATGEAQAHFLRGVAILHSFGWKQAREQFHAAQAIDPDFAMAYWGESLAYNHPLVTNMDPTEPRKALERLGATPEERIAKAPTDREKGFINAVEILWGDGDHSKRRIEYMEAMGNLHDAYPDDPEIAAFYALSLLGTTRATGDLSERYNVRAGTIALKLFRANEVHPGAAHYTIHSFDHPVNAPLALDAAYALAGIAPAVSHARHMPTHIFIQHGMWDLVSGHNESAYGVARRAVGAGRRDGRRGTRAGLGPVRRPASGATTRRRGCGSIASTSMVENEGFEVGGSRGAAGTARARGALPLLKARYIVETEEWDVKPDHGGFGRRTSSWRPGSAPPARVTREALAAAEKALAREVRWQRLQPRHAHAGERAAPCRNGSRRHGRRLHGRCGRDR